MGNTAEVGTIIHGTLRSSDLIVAFLEELDRLDPACAAEIRNAHPDEVSWALRESARPVQGDEPEAATWLLEDLFNALDDLAPTGCHFGAHEGDGSDFGFWFHGPADDDYIISDTRGGYAIGTELSLVGTADTFTEALRVIRAKMDRTNYSPDVWYVNERGNTDLLDATTGEILASYV